ASTARRRSRAGLIAGFWSDDADLAAAAPPATSTNRAAISSPASSSATSLRRAIRQLRQHHQLRHRRQRADRPDGSVIADRLDQLRRQLKRQAFIAADVIVAADILIARSADQHGARHQLEIPAARAVAEAALAHERNRGAIVPLHERLGTEADLAAIVI